MALATPANRSNRRRSRLDLSAGLGRLPRRRRRRWRRAASGVRPGNVVLSLPTTSVNRLTFRDWMVDNGLDPKDGPRDQLDNVGVTVDYELRAPGYRSGTTFPLTSAFSARRTLEETHLSMSSRTRLSSRSTPTPAPALARSSRSCGRRIGTGLRSRSSDRGGRRRRP